MRGRFCPNPCGFLVPVSNTMLQGGSTDSIADVLIRKLLEMAPCVFVPSLQCDSRENTRKTNSCFVFSIFCL